MLTPEQYSKAVAARRALKISDCPAAQAAKMRTLGMIGWDGDFVVPNQLSSRSFSGPVLLLNNWYGWKALEELSDPAVLNELRCKGYLPRIPTNRWIDRALEIVGLERQDVYITQACVFLPEMSLGQTIAAEVYSMSVERVLKLELADRVPVALGGSAQKACRDSGIAFVGAHHPSYQGGENRAQEIAQAIRQVMS